MTLDPALLTARFPRSARYNPHWVASCGMGSHPLLLTEWLSTALHLEPGMRVLDLGCGRAASSIFLAREFGVQVWAVDLWIGAAHNQQRIADAGVADRVIPLHADARSLPFAGEFFDAAVCIDCYPYFGTDDLYLNYLAHFVRPGGQLGIAGAGLTRELDGPVPEHLRQFWTQDLWALHSVAWWRRHWERTGIVEIECAETMPDGWRIWADWHHTVSTDSTAEIAAVEADQGRHLGYLRLVGRRREDVKFEPYCWPDNLRALDLGDYQSLPLLKQQDD